MADVAEMITRDVQDDAAIRVKGLVVEVVKKGLFSRRKSLVIRGTVTNRHDKDKIESIANHHAGDMYNIDNQIQVKEPAEA
jgi:hypothetical protein